jgi:hypothetical protein
VTIYTEKEEKQFIKKGEILMTLRECLYQTIHRNNKPLKLIAEEIGMSENYLTRAALPDQEDSDTGTGCRFPLKKLVPLIRATTDYSVLDHIEQSLGRVAITLPPLNDSLQDIYRLSMRSIKEFGELMAALDAGMADGRLTDKEISDLKKEGYEAVQAIATLINALEKKTPEEN